MLYTGASHKKFHGKSTAQRNDPFEYGKIIVDLAKKLFAKLIGVVFCRVADAGKDISAELENFCFKQCFGVHPGGAGFEEAVSKSRLKGIKGRSMWGLKSVFGAFDIWSEFMRASAEMQLC